MSASTGLLIGHRVDVVGLVAVAQGERRFGATAHAERGALPAPASLHVTGGASSALPAGWSVMSAAERARFLDALDANPTLLLGAGDS